MNGEIFRGPDRSTMCAQCPCATNGQPTNPIRGAGKPGSLAIVGEGPSSEEVAQGWPFVGPSGKLLQQAFSEANIDRHSIWITNALLCRRPYDPAKTALAVACCRPRLQHELNLIQPKTILALGNTAAQALHLPVTAITDARGTVQASPINPAPVITAIHPAAILRGGAGEVKGGGTQKMNVDAQMIFLNADIAKAYKLATTGFPAWEDNITLVTNPMHMGIVRDFVDEAWRQRFVAIDLEWDKHRYITWLGLATKGRAISLYWPHLTHVAHELVAPFGMDEVVAKLFHNLQADIGVWETQIGPIRGPIEDTMLLHHAAFPGAAHDLQQVTSQLLLVPPWKANRRNEEKESKRTFAAKQRAQKKSDRMLAHEERNKASADAAKERKRQRVSKHEQANMKAKLLKLMMGDE